MDEITINDNMLSENPILQIEFHPPDGWECEVPPVGPKNLTRVLYHCPSPDRALIGLERRPNSVSKKAFNHFAECLALLEVQPDAVLDLTKEQISRIGGVLGFRQWNFQLTMCRVQVVSGKQALVIQGLNFDDSRVQAVIVPGDVEQGEVYEVFYQGFGDAYARYLDVAEIALASISWHF